MLVGHCGKSWPVDCCCYTAKDIFAMVGRSKKTMSPHLREGISHQGLGYFDT